MRFLTVLVPVMALCNCAEVDRPTFDSGYSKIRLQPSGEAMKPMESEKVALKNPKTSDDSSAEEITERHQKTTEKPVEFSTEPESEQINFAKDSNSNKEKLTDATDASEVTDLNDRAVYYIYHPTGSFQKVVYRAEETAVENTGVETQYVLPIKESVITYDPRTFVFQRIIRV